MAAEWLQAADNRCAIQFTFEISGLAWIAAELRAEAPNRFSTADHKVGLFSEQPPPPPLSGSRDVSIGDQLIGCLRSASLRSKVEPLFGSSVQH